MSNEYPKYAKYKSKSQTQQGETLYEKIKKFIRGVKRVLKIANKPDREEYFLVFKICAIGLAILGALSYVIQLIFSVALPLGD
ncbi:MAG: protein translocase SEC61 complex subunit gamma [Promethearchaeia archaeon]